MSREIKFRIFDKTKKKMIYSDDLGEFFGRWSFELSQIMQYTGIKDKNEKEVWEGDLIAHEKYPTISSVVKWDEARGGLSCWELKRKLWNGTYSEEQWNHREFINIPTNRIVAGNIYKPLDK